MSGGGPGRNSGNMAESLLGPTTSNGSPPLLRHSPFLIPSLPFTSSNFSSHSQPNNSKSSLLLPMASTSASLQCHCSSSSSANQPSLLVFSGGTAFNGVVEELKRLTTRVAHVLPVSDDGGSTAEIVRVLGGPAVGDIRSRCLRLSDESTAEALAIRRLVGHRLSLDPQQAKSEWYNIVEGEHSLWKGVSRPYRETIRAFLIYFQNEDGMIIRGQNEISHPTNGYMRPIDKVLRGIGETIASRTCLKVLLLNGTHDRETAGFSASCFVTAITDALNHKYGDPHNRLENLPYQYINTLLVPKDGRVPVDVDCLTSQGILNVIVVDSIHDPKVGIVFDPRSLINTMAGLIDRYMSSSEELKFCRRNDIHENS